MLKHLKFSGVFTDDELFFSITLENPTDFGFEPTIFLFSIVVRGKNSDNYSPKLEDFTIYIMDEANCMYNTRHVEMPANIPCPLMEECTDLPNGLISGEFSPDFLFQDLRIAFYCQHYQKVNIVELRH